MIKNEKIYPGKVFLDTHGRRIQAHGASIYFENGTYYWIGENKQFTKKGGKVWTWGVKAYSSTDLMNWRDEGLIISPDPYDKNSPLYPHRELDRPHIIYNPQTKRYIAWLKMKDRAEFAIMSSNELLGPYTMENPAYSPFGYKVGDFDLAFDDKTGKGYIFVEVDHLHCLAGVLKEDFMEISNEYNLIFKDIRPPFTREGISHMERNGKHYIISSSMTNYTPNPSEVAVSDDWLGPYEVLGDLCRGDDTNSTFNSQISSILKVPGQDLYIAVADRWMPEELMTAELVDKLMNAVAARYDKARKVPFSDKVFMIKRLMSQVDTSIADYVMLPFSFDDNGRPYLVWQDEWTPEV